MIPKPVNIDLQQVPNQFQIWYSNAESLTNKMDELRARVMSRVIKFLYLSLHIFKSVLSLLFQYFRKVILILFIG